MSWHFSFTAKNKHEARPLAAKAVGDNNPHCPGSITPAINHLLDLMPEEPAKPIQVLSYGHIDKDGGNALIEVRIVP
jgi:hypothetical protein